MEKRVLRAMQSVVGTRVRPQQPAPLEVARAFQCVRHVRAIGCHALENALPLRSQRARSDQKVYPKKNEKTIDRKLASARNREQ